MNFDTGSGQCGIEQVNAGGRVHVLRDPDRARGVKEELASNHAKPRNTAKARLMASMVSLSTWPMTFPIFSRRTV